MVRQGNKKEIVVNDIVRMNKTEPLVKINEVSYTGWESNVFHLDASSCMRPEDAEILWINVINPSVVSKACWDDLVKSSHTYRISKVIFGKDARSSGRNIDCHTFIFNNRKLAERLAWKVQSSARNKRKDLVRRVRLDNAGGFHDKKVLEKIYEIQQGRCYYSGDPLVRSPKNYVKDHICPVVQGGSDWPINLALVLRVINTWKGGHALPEDTLRWLSHERGPRWLKEQKEFCREVDKKREALDREFKRSIEAKP